jgi:hypothetical protein
LYLIDFFVRLLLAHFFSLFFFGTPAEPTDLAKRFEKLAEEYTKIKTQNAILKKAVLQVRNKKKKKEKRFCFRLGLYPAIGAAKEHKIGDRAKGEGHSLACCHRGD